jgi:hypothetical protein
MNTKTIFTITVCVALLIAFWFGLDSARKWTSGVKEIGEFSTKGSATKVYDIKAGNRACMAIVTHFDANQMPQFFFSCPQER